VTFIDYYSKRLLGIYHEAQRKSPRIVCGVEEEFGKKVREGRSMSSGQITEVSISLILS